MKVYCHCGKPAELKDSKIIYKKSYGMIWICSDYPNCNSYVGCHKADGKPLGTLANKETRELRIECHDLFDPLWMCKILFKSRGKAYNWLRKNGFKPHIGEMNANECSRLIRFLKNR